MAHNSKLNKQGTIHETLTGYDFTVDPPLTPMKAIRKKCLECCCLKALEVARCHITDCTLWPLRAGKRPGGKNMGRWMAPEEKDASDGS